MKKPPQVGRQEGVKAVDIETVYSFHRQLPDGEHRVMRYSQYKKHYADCVTVPGTYDKDLKTIEVIIPEGRLKPSGVRGERFLTIWLMVGDSPDKMFKHGFRAICYENAVKRAKKLYAFVEAIQAST